jgi:hypothetical protein
MGKIAEFWKKGRGIVCGAQCGWWLWLVLVGSGLA